MLNDAVCHASAANITGKQRAAYSFSVLHFMWHFCSDCVRLHDMKNSFACNCIISVHVVCCNVYTRYRIMSGN